MEISASHSAQIPPEKLHSSSQLKPELCWWYSKQFFLCGDFYLSILLSTLSLKYSSQMSQDHLCAYLPYSWGWQIFPLASCFWNFWCDCASTIPFDVWDIGKRPGNIDKDHSQWFIYLVKARYFASFLKNRVRTWPQAISLKIKFSFRSHAIHAEHFIPSLKIMFF